MTRLGRNPGALFGLSALLLISMATLRPAAAAINDCSLDDYGMPGDPSWEPLTADQIHGKDTVRRVPAEKRSDPQS